MRNPFASSTWYNRLRFMTFEWKVYAIGILFWHRSLPKRVMVFAQGRTGSTLLLDLMRNSPELYCDGEIFGAAMPHRVLFPRFYLDSLSRWRGHGKKYYVFRLKIYELWWEQKMPEAKARTFFHSILRPQDKLIYLHRGNKFRQALSSLVAEARGFYHTTETIPVKSKIYIDPDELKRRMSDLEMFDRKEEEYLSTRECLSIQYETELQNENLHSALCDRIAPYLKISSIDSTTRIKPTSKDSIAEYIENAEEVKHLNSNR